MSLSGITWRRVIAWEARHYLGPYDESSTCYRTCRTCFAAVDSTFLEEHSKTVHGIEGPCDDNE